MKHSFEIPPEERYEKPEFKKRMKELKDYFKGCKKILEIGAGTGKFGENDSRYTGIDINKNVIKIAKKLGRNVIYGNATKIPLKSNSFDGVLCNEFIEHLYPQEAIKMFKEVERILKLGGIFMITTPIGYIHYMPTHVKQYPYQAIEKLCEMTDSLYLESWKVFDFSSQMLKIRIINFFLSFFTELRVGGQLCIIRKAKK